MNSNFKAIIFDADGVVNKSERFSSQYQRIYGVAAADMLPFFGGAFQECLVGKADLKTTVEPWLAKWRWQGSVDELLQWWFQSEHKVDSDVVELISELKDQGIKCYLATNNEKYRLAYMRNAMGFDKVFDRIFCSAEMGCKKPEQEFFAKVYDEIIKELNADKQEILFLDDDEGNVKGAEEFGFSGYVYQDVENLMVKVKG